MRMSISAQNVCKVYAMLWIPLIWFKVELFTLGYQNGIIDRNGQMITYLQWHLQLYS